MRLAIGCVLLMEGCSPCRVLACLALDVVLDLVLGILHGLVDPGPQHW